MSGVFCVRGCSAATVAGPFYSNTKGPKRSPGVATSDLDSYAVRSAHAGPPPDPRLRGEHRSEVWKNISGAGWPLDTALAAARCRSAVVGGWPAPLFAVTRLIWCAPGVRRRTSGRTMCAPTGVEPARSRDMGRPVSRPYRCERKLAKKHRAAIGSPYVRTLGIRLPRLPCTPGEGPARRAEANRTGRPQTDIMER